MLGSSELSHETTPVAERPRGLQALRLTFRLLSWVVIAAAGAGLLAVVALVTVPKVMGWQGMVVLSGSMEPGLKTGGMAFIEPVTADEIAVGDIMTFRMPRLSTMVTHRVVEINETPEGRTFVTKGDANPGNDASLVTADRVVGKVRFDVPYLGYAVDQLRHRENFYIFIGIPAAILIMSELWNIAADFRNSGRKTEEGAQSS